MPHTNFARLEALVRLAEKISLEYTQGISPDSNTIRRLIYEMGSNAKMQYLQQGLNYGWVVDLASLMISASGRPDYRLQEIANVFSGLGELAKAQLLPSQRDYSFLLVLMREFHSLCNLGTLNSNLSQSFAGLFYGTEHLMRGKYLCVNDLLIRIFSTMKNNQYLVGDPYGMRHINNLLKIADNIYRKNNASNGRSPRLFSWTHNPYPTVTNVDPRYSMPSRGRR